MCSSGVGPEPQFLVLSSEQGPSLVLCVTGTSKSLRPHLDHEEVDDLFHGRSKRPRCAGGTLTRRREFMAGHPGDVTRRKRL